MNKELDIVREIYNRDDMVKTYSDAVENVGLWESEKIIFNKYILENSKILDLGCGAGRTTINLYKNGYTNIIGLDISKSFIDFAQNYCKDNSLDVDFVVGDATSLDYEDNSFDAVIFSFNGMQCIPGKKNRDSVLKEVYRVLKHGGIYIFTAHNRDDSGKYQYMWDEEKVKWDNGTQDKDLEIYGDKYCENKVNGSRVFVHFSNLEEMNEFIKQENFEVLECIKRDNICEENEKVKEFSGSTYFWVVKKV